MSFKWSAGRILVTASIVIVCVSAGYYWYRMSDSRNSPPTPRVTETSPANADSVSRPPHESSEDSFFRAHEPTPGPSAVQMLRDHPNTWYPIYELDYNSDKDTVRFFAPILDSLPLKEKLQVLAGRISQLAFGWRKIEIDSVYSRDGRLIAAVDLRDDGKIDGPFAWNQMFGGTTQGNYTGRVLKKTFLQPDYDGDWIGAVQFAYNGDPFEDAEDIRLDGLILREQYRSHPTGSYETAVDSAGRLRAITRGMHAPFDSWCLIYDTDINTLREVIPFGTSIPYASPLDVKLKIMATRLIECRFHGKQINVDSIVVRGREQIAYVNLPDGQRERSSGGWYQAFQGSTGGAINQHLLQKTLLQPDYGGEWIDAVQFCYNGVPFNEEWDHVNFSNRKLRRLYQMGAKDTTI
jgi:hypothetical protein